MATTDGTAQAIVSGIREMLGLPDGDVDVLGAVRRLRDDERAAHEDWRVAVERAERAEAALKTR